MPESVTTDDRDVATIFAAAELAKITAINVTAKSPETLAKSFRTIFKAIREARTGS